MTKEIIFKKGETSYRCPMHPEIVQDTVGSCPICGMALGSSSGDCNTCFTWASLRLRVRSKTNTAIKTLLNLAPKKAHKLVEEGERDVSLDAVIVGDKLRIKPGEKIPLYGIVLEGISNIDESIITSEALMIAKKEGDKLIGVYAQQKRFTCDESSKGRQVIGCFLKSFKW